ncbi:hypothetical protein KA001_01950, partial [Patescibacteria group bacterium]|nr:hypothetical protein [Patescibacteria group bacterium]
MKKYLYLFLVTLFIVLFPIPIYAQDTQPPVSTITANPASPNGENGWFVTYPTITIDSTDDLSGVEAIYYQINSDPWIKNNYTNYLNLVRNSSFENGYISDWVYSGGFVSIGYKSSLYRHTGNYSSAIVSLNPSDRDYWESGNYIASVPLTTYYYSFYLASITSFLDNGFYEIVSIDSKGRETVLSSAYNIDLKLNYKNISGSFVSTSAKNSSIVVRLGIYGVGHLSIDDVSISKSPPNDSIEFILNREGINTVSFYSTDTALNKETTKVATLKIDSVAPIYQNFRTTNQINTHKFTSLI